jgi:hypothetical protein
VGRIHDRQSASSAAILLVVISATIVRLRHPNLDVSDD